MDVRNGDLYDSAEAARAAGVPDDKIVEVAGSKEAVDELASRLRKSIEDRQEQALARAESQERFRHRGLGR